MPITTTIDPPLPGDAPEVFDAKAFAAWAALSALGGEINASSVSPFPPSATAPLVEAVLRQVHAKQSAGG